jgi:predicted nucleic acid-binding protein
VTRVLLDTSAYSAFLREHAAVKGAVQGADELYLNVVVVGELLAGFRSGARVRKNEEELREFLSSPRVRLLSLDRETAVRYALVLHALRVAGTPIPTNDVWIAATAMQHGLSILTTDEHYLKVNQVLVQHFPA